jgi:hypothetical protein
MELAEVVMKLVGPVNAVGDHYEDQKRLENLKMLTEVVDVLLNQIDDASRTAERAEASMKAVGLYAKNFLNDVRGT